MRINEERLFHARNTIKDPAKLEREMIRLLTERDLLGAFQEASHTAYQGTRADSTTGLGAALSKLMRAVMFFLKLCFIEGPWNEVGSRRWILATKMITLPLFFAGAMYVVGWLAVLVVRTALWI
ncbi:unnamed protein product [Zymoseptoria tritici ST99CH_1A5]|uniref:Uncharacterized protein n=2 Tax=Zymoseptoria tritici TaxID=1047171 RepID=A0A2H1GIN2_ZYMTR|nr:unnamed protein product [Zymoseptoria tritici ST99CH_1E4]SMR55854.1 unnamed protein product [Zymoseptoria tritici ST99CH_3D1]SMY25039.1 unnamed protein product [Zymoseptoria tritici ST99CH_1A5]